MNKLPAILVVLAVVSILTAILIKLTAMGRLLPGPMPINWMRLAGMFLLFSIALSLLGKK